MGARPACAAVLATVAACAPLPKGMDRDDRDFFEDAVASIGCELVTESDYVAVGFQAAMTREQTLAFAKAALQGGRAERMENGGLRLIAGPCEA